MANGEKIIQVNIEEEMKTAYIDYSMSVIVSRAIPDARDGLKPVHRRILYAMNELGLASNRPYKKSARLVGEVLGKYHPHGDASVYDAIVRMAQWWSMRYPLVDGQGNFGSLDNDPPAAMRYTEVRLEKMAEDMMTDIDKDTVDFQFNFDDTLKEPTVMPSRIPNLLVNGSSGIAVGMATNILPHNISEVIDGINAYIDNKDITVEELIKHVKAPDFPTGGTIYGYDGVKQGLLTGRGKVVVRAKTIFETLKNGKERIIVTEFPYQVNKAQVHLKIHELVVEKQIDGISECRDESDRDGIRLVVELKRDAIPNVVLNQLYNFTQLQNSYSVNNIALVGGRPKQMNLKDMISVFVDFRHEVVVRRTKYELAEAEKRAHILEGLLIALDHLDAVIALIRASKTPDEAQTGLMAEFKLTEIQSKAILEMRLQRLTGLERDKIRDEYKELMKTIDYYKDVLADEKLRMDIIRDEMMEMKKKYGDERRSEIVYSAEDMNIEDLIADEEMVITISHLGYMKRTTLSSYKRQYRGGKGSMGSGSREEDFIEHLFIASNHNYILFFTEKGRCYWMKVYEVPEGNKTVKGRAIQNLINLPPDDKIRAVINVKKMDNEEFLKSNYLIFCTKKGIIKKTTLEEFSRPRSSGINAITIREGDELLEVKMTDGKKEVLMAVKSGKAIRFNEEKVRPMGRTAAGVKGIDCSAKDEVVGMICVDKSDDSQTILVVSEKGYGKRTDIDEYRITNRGAKGVKTLNITPKTGTLVTIKNVTNLDDLMIINKTGVTIRMSVSDIKVIGRATQGVRLIKLTSNDEIASVAKIEMDADKGIDNEDDDENKPNEKQGDMFSPN
ncbi:MAG: DNA gyrase subunit A [Chitinophagaceae bacterium]|nr:DNA gyrase subunit A [Chitinophagaceae bacterium]